MVETELLKNFAIEAEFDEEEVAGDEIEEIDEDEDEDEEDGDDENGDL